MNQLLYSATKKTFYHMVKDMNILIKKCYIYGKMNDAKMNISELTLLKAQENSLYIVLNTDLLSDDPLMN